MTLLFIFLFGLIVGSFLNAAIYRLHTGESILFERSHCPNCKHELAAVDLVPVFSFILLGGKCRYCAHPISWQYPVVEILTAIVFVWLAISAQMQFASVTFIPKIIFACLLIVIGVFDYKYYLILDKVVYPAALLAIGWDIILAELSSCQVFGARFWWLDFLACSIIFRKGAGLDLATSN